MAFALRVVPAVGLEELGERVELHELAFSQINEIAAQGRGMNSIELMLAYGLWVDGAPLGLEAVRALPGRYFERLHAAAKKITALQVPEVNPEGEP